MARFVFALLLTTALAMVACTSAQSANFTNVQMLNWTINDPASDGQGYLPLKICIEFIQKSPEVVDKINAGKVTVLCPVDSAFTSINKTNPVVKYLWQNDTATWTNLLKFHLLKGHYVAGAENAPVGSGIISLSQIAYNTPLDTVINITLYATMKKQVVQLVEEKVAIGTILPDNTTSIEYGDLYTNVNRHISLQGISGVLLPDTADKQCMIAPALCPSPPPAAPAPPPSGATRAMASVTAGILLLLAALAF